MIPVHLGGNPMYPAYYDEATGKWYEMGSSTPYLFGIAPSASGGLDWDLPVPGAYTPTCSAKHLPGFVDKGEALKAKGIDEIACTAVNDAFVLGAWGKANDATDVTMLADCNGDFVKALGLDADFTGFGMGGRGQRFSMVVDDGKVEQLNVEAPGDFRVSSAEHMLEQL